MENNSVHFMSKSRMQMQQVPLEILKARGTKPSLVFKSIKELQAVLHVLQMDLALDGLGVALNSHAR